MGRGAGDKVRSKMQSLHLTLTKELIYPNKLLKTSVYTKACTWVFIVTVFIIAKLGSNQHVLQ